MGDEELDDYYDYGKHNPYRDDYHPGYYAKEEQLLRKREEITKRYYDSKTGQSPSKPPASIPKAAPAPVPNKLPPATPVNKTQAPTPRVRPDASVEKLETIGTVIDASNEVYVIAADNRVQWRPARTRLNNNAFANGEPEDYAEVKFYRKIHTVILAIEEISEDEWYAEADIDLNGAPF